MDALAVHADAVVDILTTASINVATWFYWRANVLGGDGDDRIYVEPLKHPPFIGASEMGYHFPRRLVCDPVVHRHPVRLLALKYCKPPLFGG